jgi:hypothetical protein
MPDVFLKKKLVISSLTVTSNLNFMKDKKWTSLFVILLLLEFLGCHESPNSSVQPKADTIFRKGSFGYDTRYMKDNGYRVIELHDSLSQSKVLLSPSLQGRVMTSTASGDTGASFGWINYSWVSEKKFKAHFNPAGGEERFWIGPEGGQFAIYFQKGDSFNLAHWQVPPIIDTIPFDLLSSTANKAVFASKGTLMNYTGSSFDISISRSVELFDRKRLEEKIGTTIGDDLHVVGYESENQIRNAGTNSWKKESGLLSIWLLGMMTPSPETVVFIPFKAGIHSRELITDNYFGKIPPERLLVKDSILFFTCDGKSRSKIGLSPAIAGHMAASFDFSNNTLSILIFSVDPNGMYVNSKWEIQKFPFRGDVVNSYNDGPLADGSQLGPFYEIESSSPANELKPGESESYKQVTCHIQGDYLKLREMVRQLFGFNLDGIKKSH